MSRIRAPRFLEDLNILRKMKVISIEKGSKLFAFTHSFTLLLMIMLMVRVRGHDGFIWSLPFDRITLYTQ